MSAKFANLLRDIPSASVNSEAREVALKALGLVGKDRIDDASKLLNSALQLEPTNSYLQFFNAFVYHLAGQRGDAQKLALAEQGYLQAVQFDSSNWFAHYFLGALYFEQRNFKGAQQEWAEVLLSRHDDAEVLLRLVAASYYAGDPVTAAACLGRLRVLRPSDPQTLRLSAIVSAAIGNAQEASDWLAQYEATKPSSRDLALARERVSHWTEVRRRSQSKEQPSISRGESTDTPLKVQTQGWSPFKSQNTQAPRNGEQSPNGMQGARSQGLANGAEGNGGLVAGDPTSGGKDMVLVDVVIMQTEDAIKTRRGVNLMSALSLQFGGQGTPAYSSSSRRDIANDGTSTASTAITRAISVAGLAYSLNIANANGNVNEVLARPTLAALDGVGSEFFSGTALDAAVVSTGAGGGNAVTVSKEIGVQLSIVPQFLEGNRIRFAVNAQRTFLKPPSQDVTYTYKLEVSKIQVNANVVMDFGETLVLGGLTEKETSNIRDGVPFLQEIPLLQYLFSQRDTSNFQRSVLILITPRRPQYTFRNERAPLAGGSGVDTTDADNSDGESMKELRARYGDWFKPYPNLASVFGQVNRSSLYREFRTGDVTLERWDKQDTTTDRLKSALEFLFF